MNSLVKPLNYLLLQDRPIFGFIPRLTFKDKGNYEESGTKQFDRMAFRYVDPVSSKIRCFGYINFERLFQTTFSI